MGCVATLVYRRNELTSLLYASLIGLSTRSLGENAETGNCGGFSNSTSRVGCDGNGGARGNQVDIESYNNLNKKVAGAGGAGYITNGGSVCGDYEDRTLQAGGETVCGSDTGKDIFAEGGYAYVNGNMGGSETNVETESDDAGTGRDRSKIGGLGGFGGGGMGKFSLHTFSFLHLTNISCLECTRGERIYNKR